MMDVQSRDTLSIAAPPYVKACESTAEYAYLTLAFFKALLRDFWLIFHT